MDLGEKIKFILSGKNISPSIFADEIGIQRSSMSHILAGRNKPSLDIVQKIVKRFPDLGVNWIWDDEELPVISRDIISYESGSKSMSQSHLMADTVASQFAIQKDLPIQSVQEKLAGQKDVARIERAVEKVMIFYSDGTFEEYKSARP